MEKISEESEIRCVDGRYYVICREYLNSFFEDSRDSETFAVLPCGIFNLFGTYRFSSDPDYRLRGFEQDALMMEMTQADCDFVGGLYNLQDLPIVRGKRYPTIYFLQTVCKCLGIIFQMYLEHNIYVRGNRDNRDSSEGVRIMDDSRVFSPKDDMRMCKKIIKRVLNAERRKIHICEQLSRANITIDMRVNTLYEYIDEVEESRIRLESDEYVSTTERNKERIKFNYDVKRIKMLKAAIKAMRIKRMIEGACITCADMSHDTFDFGSDVIRRDIFDNHYSDEVEDIVNAYWDYHEKYLLMSDLLITPRKIRAFVGMFEMSTHNSVYVHGSDWDEYARGADESSDHPDECVCYVCEPELEDSRLS